MDLTIVFINYKCNKQKLQQCLNSIKIKTEIIIIDHSHDFNLIGLNIPKNLSLKIIKNINLGNGAGINCGIKNSKTQLVLYLDIDTILSENFFEILKNSLSQINDFSIIAPKIDNFYSNHKIKYTGNLSLSRFIYHKFLLNLNSNRMIIDKNIKEVYFVSGSIMLINKRNINKKNIRFDENIFMFFEEDDFFHQCFKANEKIYLIENLKARHLDGSVNDRSLNYECFKKWHWEWSKFYFLNKHYNKIIVFLLAIKLIFKFSLKILFFFIINSNKKVIFKSRLNGLLSYYLKINCKIKL